ncbi:MAG: transcriptional repressor [Candidatus Omnitrophica bacterium]|nr:transcriptional repressor [Candidatus Omnitrophota bacterium]
MNELYLNKLRENNFKLTPKRKAIIDFFLKKDRYLTPETVWRGLKKKFIQLGLPSIYRNLELFSKCGILAKIQRPDRKLYYGLCHSKKNNHHHHIICIKCGKVGEFSDCDLLKKKTINGFKITNHSLQIEGICLKCR